MPAGLDDARLKAAHKNMLLARMLDEKMLVLIRQSKSYFHIGSMGHEAVQTAAAFALTPGRDWAYPYYRDQALVTGLGMTAYQILTSFLSRRDDPNSGGRQMPQHYGSKALNIPTQSSPTGTQYLQAVGCAMASVRNAQKGARAQGQVADYEVTVVGSGEGTTSQGDFHEALNWASRDRLPVIFLVEDNGYAISVPVADQTAGGDVARLGRGYANLETVKVDGCDLVASYQALSNAVARARRGDGPTLVVARTVRLLPHSNSDDQRKYRGAEELAAERARDPIPALEALLIARGAASEAELAALRDEIKAHVDAEAERAEACAMPARATATRWVWSEKPEPPLLEPAVSGDGVVLVDAITRALAEEMERNPDVLVYGEDVGGDKGGVFTVTRGLTKRFGPSRCFNSPLAESSIVGTAVGLATRGYKPVAEIQFGDYVWTAMMQIRNELATIRYRSNNVWSCPAVLRIAVGGYIHGALCHSQNIESFFAHIPGLKIALPSTALDAYGLLKAAIRGDDPVLFLEHKGLYRQNHAKSRLPADPDWLLPFGKAAVRREGSDLTVITYGMLVQRALAAADQLADEGFACEVIDLRSLNPVDWEAITASVGKTGKCLVVHEDMRFVGYGAEIAAEVAERCFEHLDGPVRRLCAKDAPVPYNWDLEAEILPQPEDVLAAMRELARY
ncbi:MAG: tungsten formylmethanofuran dehydrogenase [Deltaproteobacteria bacterium RBG_16_71_12]|nr:MAG: tungsten formylmethanofuran dehydrogenase [Deltaproteobacteria bacterium RBG_16_71_12]